MKEDWAAVTINRREIERYLGYRKIPADDAIRSLIEECVQELESACTPRSVHAGYPIAWGGAGKGTREAVTAGNVVTGNPGRQSTPDNTKSVTETVAADDEMAAGQSRESVSGIRRIRIAGMEIYSRSLTRNLKGCTQAVLMAATLGPGCDQLVRRAEITSMTKAAVLQSAGAAMIEAYADKINREIIQEARGNNLYARPRFSPGYGDLPLSLQKDFFRILNITRTIGVSLSDNLLMTPTKSITAVIGLSPKKTSCILEGCEVCNLHQTCPYARDRG